MFPADWHKRIKGLVEKFNPYDPPYEEFFPIDHVDSWHSLEQWVSSLEGSWCFRGQRDATWLLTTSLDRAVRVEHQSEHSSGYYHLPRRPIESDYLFRFKQQAQNWNAHVPQRDDLCSWLAIMQHYGVPTRLLDFTLSPYVATYFAVEYEPRAHCALWAIDLDWVETQCKQWFATKDIQIHQDPETRADQLNDLLLSTDRVDNPVIIPIRPRRLDRRMVAQQGLFLCKLVDQAPFSTILLSMLYHSNQLTLPPVRRVNIPTQQRIPLLKKLREMNLTRASLFPGLDGFGQSLRLDLEIKAADATR